MAEDFPTCQLDPTGSGIAEFDARGDAWIHFEKTGPETGRLTIRMERSLARCVADAILVRGGIDEASFWHAVAHLEGYEFRVHITAGKGGGALSFHNLIQPYHGPYTATDADGRAVVFVEGA